MKQFIKSKLIPIIANPILKKIQKFRNIHKGEECYLFGDGSSLKYFDLEKFSNKISIPCAALPLHKDFGYLNVPYAFQIETFWFYPYNKITIPPYNWLPNEIQKLYHNVIKKRKDIHFFLSLTNYPTIWEKNVTYVFDGWKDINLPKEHLGRLFNCYTGTIRSSIFLATYMGFSKVYLVGFDYTHKPAGILHWYEKGERGTMELIDYQKDFFSVAQNFIDIVSVTLDGKAEFLKSITYKELTGIEPKFRENHELANNETLKVLSTWPDYTIF